MMYIKKIELSDYRNYESLSLEFDNGINIFYGDNAQGKTNILEAVYMAATTKSHRGSKDSEIIRFGKDEAHIRTIVDRNGMETKVDMHLRRSLSKGIAIDGRRIKKAADLLGICKVIFFSPEDLGIVKNGPSERRRFIDSELCQLDKIYLHDLNEYNKAVNQRNRLLRDLYMNPEMEDMIFVWDSQLVRYGSDIIGRREKFIDQLNEILYTIHRSLSGGKEELCIKYEPDVESCNFEKKLEDNREKDKKLKSTSAGPHRDDFIFLINGKDARKYGSQGQQRTCALSLKLAEIELVKKISGDCPVLLLDDVLSELDSNRQRLLLQSIGDIQTIITCTGLEEFVNSQLKISRVYRVENGAVSIISDEHGNICDGME